jgi:hypothetical protein
LWSACEILSCGSIELGDLGDGTVLSDGGLLLHTHHTIPTFLQHSMTVRNLFVLCITSLDRIQRLKKMGKEVLSATLVFSSHG